MNWVNLLFTLLSNPAMAALIKDIEASFKQKTAGQGMTAIDHDVAMKQAVNEVVARSVKK